MPSYSGHASPICEPELKDPGDAVRIAKSAPMLIVATMPVVGDPISLAQNVQSPDLAIPKEAGDPVALADTVKPPIIAALGTASAPDLFTISRLFLWQKPHGQYMNQLLKDIDAAKAKGDTALYNELTKRYIAWAEKYLRTKADGTED
ncbi:MAG: hypothetical protein ACKO2G_14025 [Verrucomicrobiales bacterium]